MTEHDFAMFGLVMAALIVLCIVAWLASEVADRVKEWTRSRERKWKVERLLDECRADVTRLEARVAALEGERAGISTRRGEGAES